MVDEELVEAVLDSFGHSLDIFASLDQLEQPGGKLNSLGYWLLTNLTSSLQTKFQSARDASLNVRGFKSWCQPRIFFAKSQFRYNCAIILLWMPYMGFS